VRKLVILTCMDSRMDLEQLLGLQVGDAHMIRNAGGLPRTMRFVPAAFHSFAGNARYRHYSTHRCGLLSITDEQMRFRLSSEMGKDASHLQFHAFTNLDHMSRNK